MLFHFVLFFFRNLFSYKLTKDEKPFFKHLSLIFSTTSNGNHTRFNLKMTLQLIFPNIRTFHAAFNVQLQRMCRREPKSEMSTIENGAEKICSWSYFDLKFKNLFLLEINNCSVLALTFSV